MRTRESDPGRGIRGRAKTGVALLGLGLLALPAGAQSMAERGAKDGAAAAPAQGPAATRRDAPPAVGAGEEPGPFSVRSGLGFSVGPDAFVLGFEGDYAFSPAISAGLSLELGVNDDLTFVSPVAYGRYRFDLGDLTGEESLQKLFPYAQLGLGLTYWDRDLSGAARALGADEDDVVFLLNPGFGLEYEVSPHVAVSSQMLFNIMPDRIFNERFYYSWQVLGVRYRF